MWNMNNRSKHHIIDTTQSGEYWPSPYCTARHHYRLPECSITVISTKVDDRWWLRHIGAPWVFKITVSWLSSWSITAPCSPLNVSSLTVCFFTLKSFLLVLWIFFFLLKLCLLQLGSIPAHATSAQKPKSKAFSSLYVPDILSRMAESASQFGWSPRGSLNFSFSPMVWHMCTAF